MTEPLAIKYEADADPTFTQWAVGVVGGEKLRGCIQCGVCSGVCPLSLYMDYTPRRIMHLAKEGFKDEVLKSRSIWLCASCYACQVDCPKEIQLTDIMYAFKRRAIREGYYPRGFPIPVLAREFFRMVRSHGRTSECRLVLRLALKSSLLKLLSMGRLGLRLVRRGRFSLRRERIEAKPQLRAALDALADLRRREEAG